MRQDIAVDGIGIDGGVLAPGLPFPLGGHLDNGLLAGPGNALIGRDDDTPNGKSPVERCQRKQHLDGGTVGIGDNPVVSRQDIGVDFGYDEFLVGIHPPAGGVVDDAAAGGGEAGRQLPRSRGPGGEDRQLRPAGNRLVGADDGIRLAAENDGLSDRPLRRNGDEFIDRELPLFEDLDHSGSHQSGGPYYGYFHLDLWQITI